MRLGKLLSQVLKPHIWRTQPDAFEEVWPQVRDFLPNNVGLETKTLFEDSQRRYPGRLQDGQLRPFQRREREARATDVAPERCVASETERTDYPDSSNSPCSIRALSGFFVPECYVSP